MFYFKYVKIKNKMMRWNVDFKNKKQPTKQPNERFKNFIIQTNISTHPENKTFCVKFSFYRQWDIRHIPLSPGKLPRNKKRKTDLSI